MRLPSISQYIESVESPFGLFKTIPQIEVERDSYGRATIRTGNSAVIFKASIEGKEYMLKCYIKSAPLQDVRCRYLHRLAQQSDYVRDERFLPDEIFVYDHTGEGAYHDLLIAPWIEGATLDMEIRWAIERKEYGKLQQFAAKFDELALYILDQEWAHGDLKPENIVVDQSGKFVLIDFDAMFLPELISEQTSKIGTLTFQHPLRDANMYDKHIDDYSIAIISVSLHAIAEEPSLYVKYHQSDNIILDPKQIFDGESELYDDLKQRWRSTHPALHRLTAMLNSKKPYLYELKELLIEHKKAFL